MTDPLKQVNKPEDMTEDELERMLYPYLHAFARILARDYQKTLEGRGEEGRPRKTAGREV